MFAWPHWRWVNFKACEQCDSHHCTVPLFRGVAISTAAPFVLFFSIGLSIVCARGVEPPIMQPPTKSLLPSATTECSSPEE